MAMEQICDLCILGFGENITASRFCKSCDQFLCEECKNEHEVMQASKDHLFLSVDEGISYKNTIKPLNCDLCKQFNKVSRALKLCIECKNLLLCDRCSRKHSVNTTTKFHNLTEDLTLHKDKIDASMEIEANCFSDQGTSEMSETRGQVIKETKDRVIKAETVYYIRFILLLIKGGSQILRKILAWGLERNQANLGHFLSTRKQPIRKCKAINSKQMKILYPDPPAISDVKNWDIQLLCFINLEFFGNVLNTPETVAIKKIREMRNDFLAHYSDACIDRNTFYYLWSELSVIMTTFGHKMTEAERNQNNAILSTLCSIKLDINSAAKEIKQLDNSDEFLDNIQQCLKDVLGINMSVKEDLSEIKQVLKEIQANLVTQGFHEAVVYKVYGAVHIRAETQIIVDKAEAELLAASKKTAGELGMSVNDELTEQFGKFKSDVEEIGVKLGATDKGSIILTFETHSVSELLKLIDMFECPQLQIFIDDMSTTLENITGESLQLTAYLLRDSLLEALRKMKNQEHKSTVMFNMTCTGIEGLQHALKIFEEDGASNSLNELSILLSESIGETVTLETSIDIDQLQKVILVTREQLASPLCNKESLLMSKGVQGKENSKSLKAEQISRTNKIESVVTECRSGSNVSPLTVSVCPEIIERVDSESRHQIVEQTLKSNPGKPKALKILSDTVTLSWDPHATFVKEDYYQVYLATCSNKGKWKWRKCSAEPRVASVTITELKTKTAYIFRVRAVHDNDEGPYSQKSDEITTTESPAFRLLKDASTIGESRDSPTKYMIPMTQIKEARNEQNKTKKYEIGKSPRGYVKSKTILLVGATGTGKSTLVDGIVNYALGVNWEDTFRFTAVKLEDDERERSENQALSQTDWITCYTINHDIGSRLKYQLNVIDTPGFGDTVGPTRDKEIADQLRKLFNEREPKGVTYIDAACFLIKSPDARLTVFQDYIFKSVMALFGKDMESNICYLITFADNKAPPVLAAMKEIGLPQGEKFIFNNSGLFEINIGHDATDAAPLFWKMGFQSFNSFFEYLERMPTQSLQQTHDVLNERHSLEETIGQLQPLLDLGLCKIGELEEEIKLLEENCNTIKDNQNFEYDVEEVQLVKRELPDGQFSTNCARCYITCHDNCTFTDSELKFSCSAFDSDGKCKVCPDKCLWDKHENAAFKFDNVQVKVRKQYQNMRQKFVEASGKVLTHEQIIQRLEEDLDRHSKDIELFMIAITMCTEKLSRIALRPNPLNMAKFIQMMIENEKYEKKEGFQKRIKVLKQFLKKAEIQKDYEKFSKEASQILQIVEKTRSSWFRLAYKKK